MVEVTNSSDITSARKKQERRYVLCILGMVLVCLVVAAIMHTAFDANMGYLQWAGLALTVCIFGTWGDLVESLFKRQLGIKDSGNILPGHGGMLDRFDSSLLAIPAAVLYLYTLNFF